MSKTYAVPPASPLNHGKTPAAWVMMVGVVAGAIVAAVGFTFSILALLIVGIVVIVLTVILSAVLRVMGFGQKARRAEAAGR